MYDLYAFGRMIADRVRTDAYAEALRRAVRPGATVLDIGTGTGIFSLLACRFGAERVYAVEPSDAIQAAREAARASGFADRIVFLHDVSTRIDLPERANVIVSDIRGVLPLHGRIIPSLADARERLLAPGGVMIPRADIIRAAPVEAPEPYGRMVDPWEGEAAHGFDLSPVRRAVVNAWTKARFDAGQLLAAPEVWAEIDYRTVSDPDVRGGMAWTAERAGTAHGIAAWFDAELAEGIGYSTAPGGAEMIYGTAFFPWERPVDLLPGDRIAVDLEARLAGDDYLWLWSTRVERGEMEIASFRQSTFHGSPISLARLRRRADSFVPRLGEDGRIDATILSRMDGGTSLGEIAREVRERFPARFATWEEALTRVGALSEQYASDA
ncbi:MAG TPA: 50S ribosomal protein L11 methyltransferase [Longimicrobium sp.]|nr:50S ribosomal protein L11 methyltransferase [Longimicrobium sp.]